MLRFKSLFPDARVMDVGPDPEISGSPDAMAQLESRYRIQSEYCSLKPVEEDPCRFRAELRFRFFDRISVEGARGRWGGDALPAGGDILKRSRPRSFKQGS